VIVLHETTRQSQRLELIRPKCLGEKAPTVFNDFGHQNDNRSKMP